MIIPFILRLEHDPGFLQQIRSHAGTNNVVTRVERDFNVFSESRTVVVSNGLRVSNSLKKDVLEVKEEKKFNAPSKQKKRNLLMNQMGI